MFVTIAIVIIAIIFILLLLLLTIIFVASGSTTCDKNSDKPRLKGSGESCTLNAECKPELACIQGACTAVVPLSVLSSETDNPTMEGPQCPIHKHHTNDHRKRIRVNHRKKINFESFSDSQSCGTAAYDDAHVVDACTYSSYTIYLLSDNTLVLENNEEQRVVQSDTDLVAITTFNGYLTGVSAEGARKLVYLDNNYLEDDRWIWVSIPWSPSGVVGLSVPQDKKCIWVQTDTYGYLFNLSGEIIDKISNCSRRVYGKDRDNYIIFDDSGDIVVYPDNTIYEDVKDAVIDYKGEVFVLDINSGYRMLRLINWRAFYIP
jgi:hypothetical protein